jgi:hypothetical protein
MTIQQPEPSAKRVMRRHTLLKLDVLSPPVDALFRPQLDSHKVVNAADRRTDHHHPGTPKKTENYTNQLAVNKQFVSRLA